MDPRSSHTVHEAARVRSKMYVHMCPSMVWPIVDRRVFLANPPSRKAKHSREGYRPIRVLKHMVHMPFAR